MEIGAGTVLGPYEIVAPLGAGGMGAVYRARDRRLGREVALKLVPPELLHDEAARKRFQREAQTLSALSHPNIAALFEFDSDQGVEFIVMELVTGMSLRAKVAGGPLPVNEVLALGLQMANGLAAAHSAGVVHRDLKPENVVVTRDGHLKILDFGVAKRERAPRPDEVTESGQLTQAGAVVGTVPYMAPEQLRAEPCDHRLDIYACGAVLYELATGRRPFEGHGFALVDSILRTAPPAPRALNPRIPETLEAVILKALDKEASRRYQSARELAVDLERLRTPATRAAGFSRVRQARWRSLVLPGIVLLTLGVGIWLGIRWRRGVGEGPIQSLAVLPLANFSGDPQQEYFADGMTEELTSDLAKLGSFSVISRTSVMQYKGTKKTLPEIARELNVDAVIEGSVLREGNRVRITAQLINARLDHHLWSDSYEGDVHDVLDLQSKVANAIAERVQSKLNPAQQAQLTVHRTVAPDVLDSYLRGLYQFNQGTPEAMKAALASFQQAIAKEPTYAPAYAQIAAIDLQMATLYLPPRDIMPQAKANAEKALALDPNLSEAHVALAAVHFWYDWDWPAAEGEILRAIELDKNNADAHDQYGIYLTTIGQIDRALTEFQRARELDPFSGVIMNDLVFWPAMARKYDLAIENGKKAIVMLPRVGFNHTALGVAYAMKGQYAEGIAEAEAAHRLDDSPLITSFLASIYARAGRREAAESTLASLNDQLKTRYSCSYEVAVVYLELGRTEEAFRWFQKAYEQRSDCMVMLKIDPRLDGVRPDPRYQTLLRKLAIP